jgi:hypothetical protein
VTTSEARTATDEELDDGFTSVAEFRVGSDPIVSVAGISVSAALPALVLVPSRLGQAIAPCAVSSPAIKLIVFIFTDRDQTV